MNKVKKKSLQSNTYTVKNIYYTKEFTPIAQSTWFSKVWRVFEKSTGLVLWYPPKTNTFFIPSNTIHSLIRVTLYLPLTWIKSRYSVIQRTVSSAWHPMVIHKTNGISRTWSNLTILRAHQHQTRAPSTGPANCPSVFVD